MDAAAVHSSQDVFVSMRTRWSTPMPPSPLSNPSSPFRFDLPRRGDELAALQRQMGASLVASKQFEDLMRHWRSIADLALADVARKTATLAAASIDARGLASLNDIAAR